MRTLLTIAGFRNLSLQTRIFIMSFIDNLIELNAGRELLPGEPLTFDNLRTNLTFAHMQTQGRRFWTRPDIQASVNVADAYLRAHHVDEDGHMVPRDFLEFHSQEVHRTPQYVVPNLFLFLLRLHQLSVGSVHLNFMFNKLRSWYMHFQLGDLFEHPQGLEFINLLKIWDWLGWPVDEQHEEPMEVARLGVALELQLRRNLALLLV
jgi:hypothetical protein